MLAIASICRTNRHEIVIGDWAKIGRMEGDQRLSPSGGSDEFDPDRICSIDLHHSTEIASPQPVGRYVVG